jgi:ATP-binding cassette, subfamily B, multidrug efflux pump
MLKIIRYLKPFAAIIAGIVFFLFIQAVSDLSLPDYMSRIVNIGIQQGGVPDAVPRAIRKSRLEKLAVLLTEEHKTRVLDSYTLLDRETLPEEEFLRYAREYPRLREEPVFILKGLTKGAREELHAILGKPLLILSGLEQEGGGQLDPRLVPPDQLEALLQRAEQQLGRMPDPLVTQAAAALILAEYQALGMNTERIQNRYILGTGFFMLLVALVSMAATVTVGFLGARVAAGLARNLRSGVFQKTVHFSPAEFDRFSTASLITRSTNDIQQIQMLMALFLRVVFYAPILGIGGFLKVLNSDPSMGWIIGLALAALFLVVAALFGVAIPRFKALQRLVDRLNLVTREILSGLMVIRAFNNQGLQEGKFEAANRDLTRTHLFVNRVMALMMPVMMLILNGTTLLIVWVGAQRVDQGVMQVGSMMAFIQYAMQIIMAFLMISMVSIMLPRAAVSAERVVEVLDAAITVTDRPGAASWGAGPRGRVEFRDVSFRYPGAEEDALQGISFIARPGETTAFIGSTGSGKTTLINLIPRFYDVTGGQVLVDGRDVRDLPQRELREAIGYVPQKTVLFSGTIESNVKYGVAEADPEELDAAAGMAQILDFIREQPGGYQARIAQGGANVSGGQKQRLAIARALVKRPAVLLFDDSFSALDFKTDAALRRALRQVAAQTTILIVTQRIGTIMKADQIMVLDRGRVVGQGTHQELLRSCEVYQQIALSQLPEEELA